MDIWAISTTVQGFLLLPSEEELRNDSRFILMHKLDGISRHASTTVAHIGMYIFGGEALLHAFRHHTFSVPKAHCVVISILTMVAYSLDFIRMYLRFQTKEEVSNLFALGYCVRRLCIMVERLPTAVSLLMMMSIPTKLCKDLIRTAIAVDSSDIEEAQRFYCVFWQHLNTGRRWYNAVMPAHFVNAVFRIPMGVFILVNLDVGPHHGLETPFLFVYTACDAIQMLLWLQPAMAIRVNHGVLLRAAVASACHQTSNATAWATLMASLHPVTGLKMLGFLVTWRLVTHFTTLASIVWTCFELTFKQ